MSLDKIAFSFGMPMANGLLADCFKDAWPDLFALRYHHGVSVEMGFPVAHVLSPDSCLDPAIRITTLLPSPFPLSRTARVKDLPSAGREAGGGGADLRISKLGGPPILEARGRARLTITHAKTTLPFAFTLAGGSTPLASVCRGPKK